MAIGSTTAVGPVREDTRDRLKEFRDREDHPHYEAALQALLDEVEAPADGDV